jgi:hypothetical protein
MDRFSGAITRKNISKKQARFVSLISGPLIDTALSKRHTPPVAIALLAVVQFSPWQIRSEQ